MESAMLSTECAICSCCEKSLHGLLICRKKEIRKRNEKERRQESNDAREFMAIWSIVLDISMSHCEIEITCFF
jgi:hypothetical protein